MGETWGSQATCRSSLRPLRERPSPSRSRAPTLSRLSRPRSRIRRASLRTSSVSSSRVSSSRMAAPSRTTTSRRSPPCTLCPSPWRSHRPCPPCPCSQVQAGQTHLPQVLCSHAQPRQQLPQEEVWPHHRPPPEEEAQVSCFWRRAEYCIKTPENEKK